MTVIALKSNCSENEETQFLSHKESQAGNMSKRQQPRKKQINRSMKTEILHFIISRDGKDNTTQKKQ